MKMKKNHLGHKHTDESRLKMSHSHLGTAAWNKGKEVKSNRSFYPLHRASHKLSDDHRRKLRLAAIRYIDKTRGRCTPNIGCHEKDLLDEQERMINFKILRQHRISSLGYIVDGYCPETNTVYEVYEPFHDKQRTEDTLRENEIRRFLDCDFIVIRG